MKKIFLAVLFTALLSSASTGAVSDDVSVYVRKDVFDVEMKNINMKLDNILTELKEQRKEINELNQSLAVLSVRMNGVEKQSEHFRKFLYWPTVLFGAILILPFLSIWWEKREEKKTESFVTLEEVKRLIAEANFRGGVSS